MRLKKPYPQENQIKVALIELQKKLVVADCQIAEGRLSEHEQVFGKLRERLKAR